MNILLTGASGFIGMKLIQLLKKESNYELLLLTSKEIPHYKCVLHNNYTFTSQDFLDKGFENIDILVHLGAYTPKNHKNVNNINNTALNIKNTLHLLNNLVSLPKRIIYISSVTVYTLTDELINENTLLYPQNMYGMSKLYCEKMIQAYCTEYNIEYQILRLGQIYGEGEYDFDGFIPFTIKNIISGKSPVIFNDGQALISPINVNDCCKFISKSIKLDNIKEHQQIINIVPGTSYKIIDIVNLLLKISGSKIMPSFVIQDKKIINRHYDNSLMIETFGEEEACFKNELAKEYEYFRKICKMKEPVPA